MSSERRDSHQYQNSAVVLDVAELTKEYEVSGVGFQSQTLRAVDGVSFAVEQGETFAIVGESGSGKSTIGRCLLSLTSTTRGAIRFDGHEIQGLSERAFRRFRKYLQIVFQDPLGSFNPRMKIGEALKEPLQLRDNLRRKQYKDEVVRLLKQVGLDERFVDRYPAQVSGGQLQRVGVARALAPHPKLIFLDEPTSALDLSIRGQIVNLLLDQQELHNLSYILVTHDLRVVQFMADRIAVMYLGQFVEIGTNAAIFNEAFHPYTRGLFAAIMLGEEEESTERGLFQLQGEVARLDPHYAGCRLVKRCPFARDACREPQQLREVRPGHWVRCWRAEEIDRQIRREAVVVQEMAVE